MERRLNAYFKVMAEMGLRAPRGSEVIVPVEARIASLFDAGAPTALVCYDDLVAFMVIRALSARGSRVPGDVSVMGIDDMEFCIMSNPRLTSVAVPFKEMGCEAARLLVERLDHPGLPAQEVVLPEDVVVRDSTAPPPA